MKKNLLFIIPSLDAGGGEKSLINLLSQINYDVYNVDLFLFKQEGLFIELLPKEVNILSLHEDYRLFSMPLYESAKNLLYMRKYALLYHRLLFMLKNRIIKSSSIAEQKSWNHLSKALNCLEKEYDTAIAFLEKTSTYFCIDKVTANKKIGWVHIDYDKLGMQPSLDYHYYQRLQYIVTVSDECANVMKNSFPTLKNKVQVIHNIVSPTTIQALANTIQEDLYNRKQNEKIIVSVGRLHYQKGFEYAVEACKILIDRGYSIRWYVLGEGTEREALTKLIKKHHLEEKFILKGLQANPYPFIQQADFYIQPSRFEGKSIAIDEAKILRKPIIVTNFSTAKDQINHEINGLIVDLNVNAIADGIEKLINDLSLNKRFLDYLSKEQLNTEQELLKLYQIL